VAVTTEPTADVADGGWRQRYPEDPESRRRKAANIVRVLRSSGPLDGLRLCEVGTGSGHMTSVFADAVGDAGGVISTDVVDTRREDPGNDFRLIVGDELPVESGSVDLVVSNHVIEHVGQRADQLRHLQEIHRILVPGGRVYLSTPNRWAPVENHFKLPLLGWLPAPQRDRYVRLARRGEVFDVVPLSPTDLDRLCTEAGLQIEDVTSRVVDGIVETSPDALPAKVLSRAPVHRSRVVSRMLPTQVRLGRRPSTGR
jgi:SAM-dependent methyltransferase